MNTQNEETKKGIPANCHSCVAHPAKPSRLTGRLVSRRLRNGEGCGSSSILTPHHPPWDWPRKSAGEQGQKIKEDQWQTTYRRSSAPARPSRAPKSTALIEAGGALACAAAARLSP